MVSMVPTASLWLPILLSAVAAFVASSIIHMVLKYHSGDYVQAPKEDDVMNALRGLSIPPGDYMIPRAGSMAAMKTPEFQAKWKKGPVVMMTVMPPGQNFMGAQLAQWFVYCLVVGFFTAYVAGLSLAVGTPYPQVFRVVATVSFMGYALGQWPQSIWYRKSWMTTLRLTIDAVIFASLTAGMFGWLWPR